LDYLWVEPGFRRQGVAYGLLAAFLLDADGNNVEAVYMR